MGGGGVRGEHTVQGLCADGSAGHCKPRAAPGITLSLGLWAHEDASREGDGNELWFGAFFCALSRP